MLLVAILVLVPVCLGVGGILAAIAIPNFIAMSLKAKRAEAPTNVDGIRVAEKAYHHEWDTFTSAGPTPDFVPGRNPVPFAGENVDAFYNLGWSADGLVRCQYEVVAIPGNSGATDDFVVTGTCDADGDGDVSIYQANRANKAEMVTYNNVY